MKSWRTYMNPDIISLAEQLTARVQTERDRGIAIYPPQDRIFQALKLTPPDAVRVVIIGQDPYHNPGEANGLAFSVSPGIKVPPSLRNIFKELQSDLGFKIPGHGDLTRWAESGVLLLNTSLTVEKNKPASHSKWGWQSVIAEILRICVEELPQPIVFILWGGHARTFTASLDIQGHPGKAYICSSHPSPLGARKGSNDVPAFLGSRPFSRANQLLSSMGAEPVNWSLE